MWGRLLRFFGGLGNGRLEALVPQGGDLLCHGELQFLDALAGDVERAADLVHALLGALHRLPPPRGKPELVQRFDGAALRFNLTDSEDLALDGREVIVESRQRLVETGGRRLVLESNRDVTGRNIMVARDGRVASLAPDGLDALRAYDWPGNVRELENALERALILARGDVIELSALPARIGEPQATPLVGEPAPENPTLEVIERAYIAWVLRTEGGNKARAAEILGIDPSTLYRKINRYGLGE